MTMNCPRSSRRGPSTPNLWVNKTWLAKLFCCECISLPTGFVWLFHPLADLHTLCHGSTKASDPSERSFDSAGVSGAAREHVQHNVPPHWPPEKEVQNDRWGDPGETQYVSLCSVLFLRLIVFFLYFQEELFYRNPISLGLFYIFQIITITQIL